MIEQIYNFIFQNKLHEDEWRLWHNRTQESLIKIKVEGGQPKEISDPTEIKYYSLLSDDIINLIKKSGGKIHQSLEVGSGSGALSLILSEKSKCEYTLVDNSSVALEYASFVHTHSMGHRNSILANATNLPFNDNSFDLVHSVGLIEHFDNDTIQKIVHEMSRVMRPNGFLYLAVPNFFSPDLIKLWIQYGKNSERYIPCKKMSDFAKKSELKIIAMGTSSFVFDKNCDKFIPQYLEKHLGSLGIGFLKYVFARKAS